ncbi:CC0125/CC1285 family lipoprotein [Brevundimonas sp. FT23028]|uniref:CC0125/CC1285 family lipoprotein n=1 Tax=Brevundimonas sp. FT23028 TaxID=3393748 RepID=UPI003B58965E
MNTRFLKPVLLVTAAALALSACATATPYGPASAQNRYGYSEQRVDSDRFRVNFAGNSVTSREQVEMALLLRAAELTLESGHDWFATVNRSTDRDVRLQATRDPFADSRYSPFWGPNWRYYSRGYWSPWGYRGPIGGDLDVREIDRFEATAEIVMGRGPKPTNDPNAFDAREVVSNLGGRVPRS